MNTTVTRINPATETLSVELVNNPANADKQSKTLREYVKQALQNYFAHLDGHTPSNLYDLVLEEVEIPLLETVMQFVKKNQCKAATLLGISRGTLRKN